MAAGWNSARCPLLGIWESDAMSNRWGLLVGLVVVMSVACEAPEPTQPASQDSGGSGDLSEFCEAANELDEVALDGYPDDALLDRFVEAAPPDIREDAEILVASAREFRSGNEEAGSSEKIQAAGDRFDAYVKSNCSGDQT